jgi:glycosyltransferase involved in cell wall biosynthesis
VRQGGCSHRLLLVGSRGSPELQQRVAALGVSQSVSFLDYVADEELPLAYRAAEVFAFCSLSEGFGIPLLEAMASDVPIVTSNVGAMAEVAGAASMLVDPYSVRSIADGLGALIRSPVLRRELIAKGRRRLEQFSWDLTARQTLEVYQHVEGLGAVPHPTAHPPVESREDWTRVPA